MAWVVLSEWAYILQAMPNATMSQLQDMLHALVSEVMQELQTMGKRPVAWTDITKQIPITDSNVVLQAWKFWEPCDVYKARPHFSFAEFFLRLIPWSDCFCL